MFGEYVRSRVNTDVSLYSGDMGAFVYICDCVNGKFIHFSVRMSTNAGRICKLTLYMHLRMGRWTCAQRPGTHERLNKWRSIRRYRACVRVGILHIYIWIKTSFKTDSYKAHRERQLKMCVHMHRGGCWQGTSVPVDVLACVIVDTYMWWWWGYMYRHNIIIYE